MEPLCDGTFSSAQLLEAHYYRYHNFGVQSGLGTTIPQLPNSFTKAEPYQNRFQGSSSSINGLCDSFNPVNVFDDIPLGQSKSLTKAEPFGSCLSGNFDPINGPFSSLYPATRSDNVPPELSYSYGLINFELFGSDFQGSPGSMNELYDSLNSMVTPGDIPLGNPGKGSMLDLPSLEGEMHRTYSVSCCAVPGLQGAMPSGGLAVFGTPRTEFPCSSHFMMKTPIGPPPSRLATTTRASITTHNQGMRSPTPNLRGLCYVWLTNNQFAVPVPTMRTSIEKGTQLSLLPRTPLIPLLSQLLRLAPDALPPSHVWPIWCGTPRSIPQTLGAASCVLSLSASTEAIIARTKWPRTSRRVILV